VNAGKENPPPPRAAPAPAAQAGLRRLIVFGALGAAALAGLVALPDRAATPALDHRTGERARTPALILEQARHLGDARAALDLLRTLPDAETAPDLAMAVQSLRAELTTAAVPTDGSHPLHARLHTSFTAGELAAWLADLEDDAHVAARTHAFFAPSADLAAASEHGERVPPDALAARALEQDASGDTLDVTAHLAVAAAFSAAGRLRARTRWLLRAFAAFPHDERLRLQLALTYCKDGRYREALAVTSTGLGRPANDTAFWQLRCQLARWLGQQDLEADALERVLQTEPGATALRLRLLELYAALGRADAASAQAAALADRTKGLLEREQAVAAALEAGDARQAIEHLQSLVAAGHDVQLARERIVDIALLDLDHGQAITTLRELIAAHPEADDYKQRLERVYRRCDMAEPLADLLAERFAQQPADLDLGLELLHLLVGLERRAQAEAVLARMQDSQTRPATFFKQIARIAATSALQRQRPVEAYAEELAASPALTPSDLAAALDGLRPVARQRRFKPTLEILAQRFGHEAVMQRFLLDLVQAEADVATSVATAEEVAALSNEASLVREWAKRAAWVGLHDSERKARTRLADLDPEDLDNRQALAWMLTTAGEHKAALPHWRALVAHGARGDVAAAYVEALLRCGEESEALRFLRAQAEHPDASLEERLRAAEALLGANQTAAAAASYERVLALVPEHPQALLRLGQIKFWANDPGGAVPLLERRLALEPAGDHGHAQTHFALAEALVALRRGDEAAAHYEAALRALEARAVAADTNAAEDAELTARCLARLHRDGAAIAAYEQAIALAPAATELHLDLAELLRGKGDLASAHAAIAAALAVAPEHKRALRARADLALEEGDPARARSDLERSLELHGADADVFAALAHAHELAGDYVDALDAYRRQLALQTDSRAALRGARDMFDRTQPFAGGAVHFQRAGRDHRTLSEAHGAADVADRVRLSLHAGLGEYSGRSPAVAGGTRALRERIVTLGGQLAWRLHGRTELAAGGELYADAPGDRGAGWLNLHLEGQRPYAALDLRLALGELWTDAAAGAALGARRDGGEVQGHYNLGDRAWVAGEFGLWSARARDPASGGEVEDTLLHAQVAVGWRFTAQSVNAVADRFRRNHAPTGPFGPAAAFGDADDWQAAAWLAVHTTRLLGREELPAVLPVGDRFDYALLAGRIDKQLGARLGAMVEGFAGSELHTGDATWSLGAASSFRPHDQFTATLGVSFGDAMARQGAGSSTTSVFLHLQGRW
jgi:predicted Zn-dependent protease